MNLKTIICHNGQFHADEITAIALLEIFKPSNYAIMRIPHQSTIPEGADYIIDIGRTYDGKRYFDHHQWVVGQDEKAHRSSAGLIWEYLNLEDTYPNIDKLITLIDENDVGIRKATFAELPRIIGAYNTSNIYNDGKQMMAFNKAKEVITAVLLSMKEYQDRLHETEETLIALYDSRSEWELENNVIIAPKYMLGWDKYLNKGTTPDLRCIMWPKEDNSEEWQAQVLPVEAGSYEQYGHGFEQDDSMIFVHSGKFFCVAKDKSTMMEYLTCHG